MNKKNQHTQNKTFICTHTQARSHTYRLSHGKCYDARKPEGVTKSSLKKRYLSQDLILPALMPSFLVYKMELTMVASIASLRIKLDNNGIRFTSF